MREVRGLQQSVSRREMGILGAYERCGASEHGEAKSFKNTNPGLPSKVAIFRHPLKNGVINALQPL